ncbi:FBD-associated F-box protein At4g13985-like [Silene latifolia]|uniref:FBD-associated F-box protein At4g13985-like n=1 Tax=Silene latifolia TaxID=37657 RepID=UPI003D76BA38
MMFGENVAKVKKGTVDRISELPEFILHTILSMLDTKEACRASVLSKRWYDVWSSIPVLDFRFQYFKGDWDSSKYDFNVYCDPDTIQSFLGLVDRTMQRYFTARFRIMKLNLEFPIVDGKIGLLVDQWFEIAVQSHIEELQFKILYESPAKYRLPEILFRAKSLKVLNCENVVMPYYEIMELNSLEYLTLTLKIIDMDVDMDMLQRIISFCPLVELDITKCYLEKLCLPWARKGNETAEYVGNGIMRSNFKASPLRKLAYNGFSGTIPWPWNMNVIALKNLRKL